jgi:hypothetical protein
VIKAEVIFNGKVPDLDMSEALFEIAKKIIVPSMQISMDREVDLNGAAYAPLAVSTLKAKMRKGLSPLVLHAENRLRNAFTINSEGRNTVVISIDSSRHEIGSILKNKGVNTKRGKRFFNFFGVNDLMEVKAVALMKKKIAEAIKNAGY